MDTVLVVLVLLSDDKDELEDEDNIILLSTFVFGEGGGMNRGEKDDCDDELENEGDVPGVD